MADDVAQHHPSTLTPLGTTLSWLVPTLLVLFFSFLAWELVHLPGGTERPGTLVAFGAMALVIGALLASYAHRPMGIELSRDAIVLVRPSRSKRFDRQDVRSLAILDRGALGTPIRLAGTTGFFGHYGWYWTRKHGRFVYHATRLAAEHIAIEDTRGRRWVATVDDMDGFVKDALDHGWTLTLPDRPES